MPLRFSISASLGCVTLIGVRSLEEVEQAISAWRAGPLSPELLSLLHR